MPDDSALLSDMITCSHLQIDLYMEREYIIILLACAAPIFDADDNMINIAYTQALSGDVILSSTGYFCMNMTMTQLATS